jgi:hypothetical protein
MYIFDLGVEERERRKCWKEKRARMTRAGQGLRGALS